MKPQLIVEQKITAFVNQYRIFAVDESGKKSELKAFAQQKRLALKEKITFYTDEQKTSINFELQAEKVLDLASRYNVKTADGDTLGSFKKEFQKSLLNSTWTVFDRDDRPVLGVHESNTILALLRRFVGFVPIIGGILEIVTAFLRYHFVFETPDGRVAGTYRKTTLFRDHYVLSSENLNVDWRVLAAQAVALDALQSR